MAQIDIPRLRLANQRIGVAPLATPDEVVSWLGAVQAQDYSGAKWALGLRMRAATDRDLDQAFSEGQILRTHLLRPTWHFVTPGDIHWLLALTAPRVHAVNAGMYRKLGLDLTTMKRSQALLVAALQGGEQRTRAELGQALEKGGVAAADGLRLAYILMAAELDALVCSGARRGKQFTYALLDERAPSTRTLDHTEALAELARRFFLSRGPATVHDFSKWSGLTVTEARRGLEAVADRLEQERNGNLNYWFSTGATAWEQVRRPAVDLVSIYDEYISGYKDRSDIVTAEHATRLVALDNDLSYVIVLDGQIVGTWKRKFQPDAVLVETNLFVRLTENENEALACAARRYAAFQGRPAVRLDGLTLTL